MEFGAVHLEQKLVKSSGLGVIVCRARDEVRHLVHDTAAVVTKLIKECVVRGLFLNFEGIEPFLITIKSIANDTN